VLEHGGIGFFFWTLEKVDPHLPRLDSGQPQGEGVVVAIVLPMPYMFPTGTATALGLTVSSGGRPGAEGRLVWRDGLVGSGQPVENAVTAEGAQYLFCARQPATIRFVEGPPSFLRGDANADGRLNVADPISVLVELFHGGRPSPCAAAADATGDRRVDVSDPIRIFGFLFLGDPPPPAPFPECGSGESDPGLPCPRGSHPSCP
jgi:hypothetical protein